MKTKGVSRDVLIDAMNKGICLEVWNGPLGKDEFDNGSWDLCRVIEVAWDDQSRLTCIVQYRKPGVHIRTGAYRMRKRVYMRRWR